MERIVLTGSGGCMRELLWQMECVNRKNPTWVVDGYVGDMEDLTMEGIGACRYLGDEQYLLKRTTITNLIICTTDPDERRALVEKYANNPFIHFPSLVLSRKVAPDVEIGRGVIISEECVVSSNVTLGDFSFLGIGCVVAHDGNLGEFATLGIRVSLAGTVSIGNDCYLEIGTIVRQGTTIEDRVTVAAGGIVAGDL